MIFSISPFCGAENSSAPIPFRFFAGWAETGTASRSTAAAVAPARDFIIGIIFKVPRSWHHAALRRRLYACDVVRLDPAGRSYWKTSLGATGKSPGGSQVSAIEGRLGGSHIRLGDVAPPPIGHGQVVVGIRDLRIGSQRLAQVDDRFGAMAGSSVETSAWPSITRMSVGSGASEIARRIYRALGHSTTESEGERTYGGSRLDSLTLNVDELGDVLVTETRGSVRRRQEAVGWWETPASPHKHQLPEMGTTKSALSSPFDKEEPPATADAALSEGRIAYAIDNENGAWIELLDLHTHTTRTVAHLWGVTSVVGLDLSRGELVWAQQNAFLAGYHETKPDGSGDYSCKLVVLSQPQLISVKVDSLPPAPLTIGLPKPADAPGCQIK